jgi:hypothetical protein
MVSEEDVRRIALGLPSTTERPSYGTPGFRVGDRLFARILQERDVLVLWCADRGEKETLVESDPVKFFSTAHYDRHPTVLVRLRAVDPVELTELLTDSWRVRAPARLVAEVDARPDGDRAILDRLRRICLALPETTERLSHGEPIWFVRDKKTYAMYAERHHDDRLGFWCPAPPGGQEALIAECPERFFRPPCVGWRGWVGMRLDVPVDWAHVAEIIEEAYRVVAPRRLVTALDQLRTQASE